MSETDLINLGFRRPSECEALSDLRYYKKVVNIDDKNAIILYGYKIRDSITGDIVEEKEYGTFPYKEHLQCGGQIDFIDMLNHKIIVCRLCFFRKQIPSSIKTVKDLKAYYEKVSIGNETNRAELLDLD